MVFNTGVNIERNIPILYLQFLLSTGLRIFIFRGKKTSKLAGYEVASWGLNRGLTTCYTFTFRHIPHPYVFY